MTTFEEDGVKSVRIVRIMPSLGNTKWRVMYENGGLHWMTLFPKDIALMRKVGAQIERAFVAADLVFEAHNQPSVQIIEERGNAKLHAVWDGQKYVTHEEGIQKVTEESKVITPAQTAAVVQQQETTIAELDAKIDNAFNRMKKERVAARDLEKVVLDQDELDREDAEVMNMVLERIDEMEENLGMTKLRALWRIRKDGKFRALPNTPQSVVMAIRPLQLENRDYTLSIAKVVDVIFSEVDAMHSAGKPFINSNGNVPVTVDSLILAKGLVRKLTKSAEHWLKLTSTEDKAKLLDMILNGTADQVAALRDTQSKVTKADDRFEVVISPIKDRPGYSTVTIVVDEAQELALVRALKPLIKEVKQ